MSYRFIVCAKQVPDTEDIKMDPQTGTLIRQGVQSVMNPFDGYALELAFDLRARYGGTVTVVSMGIPAAADMLQDALYAGADRAVLLSDRGLAGSDTLATAYALSQLIAQLGGYDLILCGKQATDGDTAQVGPEIAQQLAIPHIAYVGALALDDATALCTRLSDYGYEDYELRLPALVTVTKEASIPRLPSVADIRAGRHRTVEVWSAADAGLDPARCGLSGSPTQVKSTFVPQRAADTRMLVGTADEKARQLSELLASWGTGGALQ